jgi:ribosomal protein S18 acetylase RimI-like enzyme
LDGERSIDIVRGRLQNDYQMNLITMSLSERDEILPRITEEYIQERMESESVSRETAETIAKNQLKTITGTFYWVVRTEDSKRIGHVWLAMNSQQECFIYNLALDLTERGQGLGKKLMQLIEQVARDQGALALRLHVFGKNIRAQQLYLKMGFHITNINMAKFLR